MTDRHRPYERAGGHARVRDRTLTSWPGEYTIETLDVRNSVDNRVTDINQNVSQAQVQLVGDIMQP